MESLRKNIGENEKEGMLLLNQEGYNRYHIAARRGELHKIPKKLISEEGLLSPSMYGASTITMLINKCIGRNGEELDKNLKKDLIYALTFLEDKQLSKVIESGITRASYYCQKERVRRKIKLHTRILGSEEEIEI